MEQHGLRFRIVSFNDSAKKKLNNTLFYIKKFIELPTEYVDTIKLEPNEFITPIVISINETFDWNINDGNYCQIICLTPNSTILADTILWFDHLLNLTNDPRYDEKAQSELPCSITLKEGYEFEFSLQPIELPASFISSSRFARRNNLLKLPSNQQTTEGHLMKLKQFDQPVHCAVCHGSIRGFHHHGFECLQCSLVTHRKCRNDIPFWCEKSSGSMASRLNFIHPHTFKTYEVPFVRAFVTRNHIHCDHCGAQIFRNALKCTQCSITIHERCQSNVSQMCKISDDSPPATPSAFPNIVGARFHVEKIKKENNQISQSSSFDLSWLDPLPKLPIYNQQTISLPKFSDFEFIGRLGDGASGQVYCVQHTLSKKYLAIKVADGKNGQARQQLEVEKYVLFRHSSGNPYMVKAYCAFHQGNKLFLGMELVQGGSLCHKIQTKRMNEDEIRYYLAQTISVIQYLHSNKIVYRDLKLEHVIVCSTGSIRLIDYGLGRLLKTPDEICHTFCGTYSYMAPEVRRLENGLSDGGYSYAVDFWALGIMLVQMLCGEKMDVNCAFSSSNADTTKSTNITEYLPLPRCISLEAHSCVIGLLENDPEKRLGSPNSPHGAIRNHKFFKAGHQINWQEIDEEIFKPGHKTSEDIHVQFGKAYDQQLSDLPIDRGIRAKDDWIAAGKSTCAPDENERLQSFDYVSESSWREFTLSNVF
ncbi:unnamed protein product [Rotaria sp. Silwood1]|nr:unnamed protein product [Rotaria sp. Silwood1]CAF4713689.1 unnamed protein product [Rotaria sp. Silwood1]